MRGFFLAVWTLSGGTFPCHACVAPGLNCLAPEGAFQMSMRSALLALALLALTPLPGLAQGSGAEPEQRLIVRFRPQADSVRAKALAARATRSEARDVAQTRATALGLRRGHSLTAGRSLDERTHVIFARGRDAAALARQLAADPEVELAVVDQRRRHTATLPNDPLFGGAAVNPEGTSGGVATRVIDQWYLKAPSSTPGQVVSSINAPAAWDISTGSSSVVVAVLDTGVRKDHPDLADKIVGGYDFIGYDPNGAAASSIELAVANDSDGADADASDPGDWVSQTDINGGKLGTGCTSDDIGNSSWHGTRVSGLIGASSNNGLGMAGVAWGVRLLPVRVLGKCGGYDSDIMAGMRWAVRRNTSPSDCWRAVRMERFRSVMVPVCPFGLRGASGKTPVPKSGAPPPMPTFYTLCMSTISELRQVLASCKTIAVVGLSPQWHRPSYFAAKYMQAHGYRIVPVNPVAKEDILGERCYPTLTAAAADHQIDMVDCFRKSEDIPPLAEEAIAIANDTLYGLGAGVWTRDAHEMYQVPRQIQAGRVWVNCYHAYPAHAPFGGYKKSGFGRETHKMMLNHYRQTKNMLISYSKSKLGFF